MADGDKAPLMWWHHIAQQVRADLAADPETDDLRDTWHLAQHLVKARQSWRRQDADAKRFAREALGRNYRGELWYWWQTLHHTAPGLTFLVRLLTVVLGLAAAHGLASLVPPAVLTDDPDTQRYFLSAVAQSIAALTGIALTVLIIGTQMAATLYSSSLAVYLVRTPVGHWATSLLSVTLGWSLLLLGAVVKDGSPPIADALLHDNALLPVMLLTVASVVLLGMYAARVMLLFTPARMAAWLRAELVSLLEVCAWRVRERETRDAALDALCEREEIARGSGHLFGHRHGIKMDLGNNHLQDMQHYWLREGISQLRRDLVPEVSEGLEVNAQVDAGPGECLLVSSNQGLHEAPTDALGLVLASVRTQRLPYDLWHMAGGFGVLTALCERAVRSRELEVARRGLGVYRDVVATALDLTSECELVSLSDLSLFGDLFRSLRTLTPVVIHMLTEGGRTTILGEEFSDLLRGLGGRIARAALDHRDADAWSASVEVLSDLAYLLHEAGDDSSFAEFSEGLHDALNFRLWPFGDGAERELPNDGDAAFVEVAMARVTRMGRKLVEEGRPGEALSLLKRIYNGAVPQPEAMVDRYELQRLRRAHNSAQSGSLEADNARAELDAAEAAVGFQTAVLSSFLTALYGLSLHVIGDGALSEEQKSQFIAEGIDFVADELKRRIALTTDVFEAAREELNHDATSTARATETDGLRPMTSEDRQMTFSIIDTNRADVLHLAIRVIGAARHAQVLSAESIECSDLAADFGAEDGLTHVLEEFEQLRSMAAATLPDPDDLPRVLDEVTDRYRYLAAEGRRREMRAPIDAAELQDWETKMREVHETYAVLRHLVGERATNELRAETIARCRRVRRDALTDTPHSTHYAGVGGWGAWFAEEEDRRVLAAVHEAAHDGQFIVALADLSPQRVANTISARFPGTGHDEGTLCLLCHPTQSLGYRHLPGYSPAVPSDLGVVDVCEGSVNGVVVCRVSACPEDRVYVVRAGSLGAFVDSQPLRVEILSEEIPREDDIPQVEIQVSSSFGLLIDFGPDDVLVLETEPPDDDEDVTSEQGENEGTRPQDGTPNADSER